VNAGKVPSSARCLPSCRWLFALAITLVLAVTTNAQSPPQPGNPNSFGQFQMIIDDDRNPSPADSVLPPPVEREQTAEAVADNGPEQLALADVIASLYRSYPEIVQARQQPNVAGGELRSAYGAYDTKFGAFSLSEPTGFYENYRSGLGVARQTWWGGYLAAGYRIGRGSFQPWYKERQTDEAGEFKAAFAQPLLQGRAIDPQRVALFQASLGQQAAGPIVQRSILDSSREAAAVYWQWVAAGAVLEAQRELLAIAEKRGQQFQDGVKAGKFAPIDLVLNRQLIAERRTNRLEAERKFQAVTFKLSLFLRDETGQPLVPNVAWLPPRFPTIEQITPPDFAAELSAALSRRPELQILDFELRQVQLDRRLARNEMLPRVDFVTEASQDMGPPASKSDDKGEFELVIGFQSEVPIQRRKARGKIQSTTGKLAQINQKIRLTQDKIETELRTAYNALALSWEIVQQSELSLRLAIETLEAYRFAFTKGKIDLIYLNLLETKANEDEIKLVKAQQDWFAALSELQVVLGLDPLDQAIAISALPPSQMPGPGNLPAPRAPADLPGIDPAGGNPPADNAPGAPGN
jgi:outer membrane protein TolC